MIKVKCAICGYIGDVKPHYDWYIKGKAPKIWFCDIHQVEFARDAIMKKWERDELAA